jgi:glycosyltransferase involved in cell wall biosynthesis
LTKKRIFKFKLKIAIRKLFKGFLIVLGMVKSRKKGGSEDSDPDSLNVQEDFEEEMKKPYYDVFYLDDFKLPYERLNVSAIIPAYNRSPYKPQSLKKDLNPLAWTIRSLILQTPIVKEIIVVDDCSDDYTADIVEMFRKECEEKKITLKYLKTKETGGWPAARNLGAANANTKYLFFVDDDSVIAPYAIFGAIFTYEWLKERGINVGILNLSPYARTSIPNKIAKKKEIGHIDFSQGEYTGNKNAFPEEYINGNSSEDKFIHKEYHILKPFPIKNNGGYILCEKDIFMKVNGFPISILRRFVDREFGCIMMENGYSVYHQADPKFHCVHGSYGLKSDIEFEGKDWFNKFGNMISLKKAMKECNKPSLDQGNRIDADEYYYQVILSVFCMLYPRNKGGAKKWLSRVYKKFVEEGDLGIFYTSATTVPPESERREMWHKAVKEGLEFVEKKEEGELENIRETISKIKDSEDDSPEAIGKIIKILERF